jgi:hypothetical protein
VAGRYNDAADPGHVTSGRSAPVPPSHAIADHHQPMCHVSQAIVVTGELCAQHGDDVP